MKNIVLMITSLLFFSSCYSDKGNYDYTELSGIKVSRIEAQYRVALLSLLPIEPKMTLEDKNQTFEYLWYCFDKGYSTVIPVVDTLSREKDLKWIVNLKPAVYELVFCYTDTKNNITRYVRSEMIVESSYSRGWYLLKNKSGATDIDFHSDGYANTDLLTKSLGAPLPGKPSSLGFIDKFAFLDTKLNQMEKDNPALVICSEEEMKVVRVTDISLMSSFEGMFFSDAPTKAPGKWFASSDEFYFINNGKLESYDTRTSQIGIGKFSFPKIGTYHLSTVFTKNGTMCPLLFDQLSGKFCTGNRGMNDLIFIQSDAQSTFPDTYLTSEPIYAGFLDKGMWNGGVGYVVMKEKSSEQRTILHMDLNCLISWDPSVFKNRITAQDALPLDSKVGRAEVYGMNRSVEMLYFSFDNKLYYYDLINKRELEVLTESGEKAIGSSEKISLIKHITYNDSYNAPDEVVDVLVLGVTEGANYKLYLYEIVGNKLKANPTIFEGEGIPSEIMYMSSKMNNGYLCY